MNKFNKRQVVNSPIGAAVVHSVITIEAPRWDTEGKTRYQYTIINNIGHTNSFEEAEISEYTGELQANLLLSYHIFIKRQSKIT